MGSSLSKILGGGAALAGAAVMGSQLFPETIGSLFGGGASTAAMGGNSLGGNVVSPDVLSNSSSVFSNPTVLSSGILAGTSLLSNLFGSSAQDELAAQNADELKRQFDLEMAYKNMALAQQMEIAKLNASRGGGGGGNGAAVAAQLKIARANALANNAQQKAEVMQMPLAYLGRQADAAQNTGAQSGAFFNNLAALLQAPAMKRA